MSLEVKEHVAVGLRFKQKKMFEGFEGYNGYF